MFEVYLVFASAQNFSIHPRKFDLEVLEVDEYLDSGVNGLSSLCVYKRGVI